MRKHIILFFSALLLFVACKFDDTPKGIIKKDEMTDLLTQLHLVDGSIYNVDPSPDSLYKFGAGKYVALFKHFNTDSTQFKKSLLYYSKHPDVLEAMYGDILKNLTAKQDSLNKVILKQNKQNALPAK